MLFNLNWKQPEIKADPFSLDALIAWLEKQPGEGKYEYTDSDRCMVAQYLKASRAQRYDLTPGELVEIGWAEIAVGPGGLSCEDCRALGVWTFGAALERARAARLRS